MKSVYKCRARVCFDAPKSSFGEHKLIMLTSLAPDLISKMIIYNANVDVGQVFTLSDMKHE